MLYKDMHDAYTSYGIGAVIMFCVFVLIPPVAMIAGSGFLIKPYQITSQINEALESGKVFELPEWINDCSRGDQQFAEMNQIRTDGIQRTMSEM